MIVYTARKDVLNLSRARHVWPKELQLISRQTDKHAKKLASQYKKILRTRNRIEPFEDNGGIYNYHQDKYARCVQDSGVVDLTMKHGENSDAALASPKASRASYICEVGEQLEVSSEKNTNQGEDVPAAQIVIPTAARKTLLSSNKKFPESC